MKKKRSAPVHVAFPMKYSDLVATIDTASQELLGRVAAVVNQALVLRNWLVGAYIVEYQQAGKDRAKYGTKLLPQLSGDLAKRGVKGCSRQMLDRMRQFYRLYPQLQQPLLAEFPDARICSPVVSKLPATEPELPAICSPVVSKLADQGPTPLSPALVLQFSWTKLIELIAIEDPLKRAFYENECLAGNWSKRQLQRQIGSLLYERTGLSKDKKAVVRRAQRQEPQESIQDILRDPYVLEFAGLAERAEYTESELESALLDHLQIFLLELGAGFCFEARQKRITVGNKHDYIDLVFYHRRLRCHVLVDLKIRAFRHADAGQMNFYLNWWKRSANEISTVNAT
jgi:predicted nuclease of restriction endonuclease-like (RecB) superfamily